MKRLLRSNSVPTPPVPEAPDSKDVRNQYEKDLGSQCQRYLLTSQPNMLSQAPGLGGFLSGGGAAMLRLNQGSSKTGFPDLSIIELGCVGQPCLHVEFKTPGARRSGKLQGAWHKELERRDHTVVVVTSVAAFKKALFDYLYGVAADGHCDDNRPFDKTYKQRRPRELKEIKKAAERGREAEAQLDWNIVATRKAIRGKADMAKQVVELKGELAAAKALLGQQVKG